jgi:hypothetical protein
MVVLFVVGYRATATYAEHLAVADSFEDVEDRFDVWVGVLGAVGGFALAAGLWFVVTITRLRCLFVTIGRRTVGGWVLVVLVVGTAILTVLVISTGLRRRAVMAADPSLDHPVEGVLPYGLVFAAQLGLFYVVATTAIDRRTNALVAAPSPTRSTVLATAGRPSSGGRRGPSTTSRPWPGPTRPHRRRRARPSATSWCSSAPASRGTPASPRGGRPWRWP